MTWSLHRTAAVSGIGFTDYTKESGRTVLSLAVEACQKAIEDSGIDYDRVDGFLSYGLNDTIHPHAVANALGVPEVAWYANYFGGGNMCVSTLGTAAMIIDAGLAKNVVIFRAMNGRSAHRLGGTDTESMFVPQGEAQFTFPQGWLTYAQYIAMAARRHMIKYGTTSEDFGNVAVTCRTHAEKNPRAMMRAPMTLEDHQHSRLIADPLRLYDICLETDGACALLVSSATEAESLRHKPAYIAGCAMGGGHRPGFAFDGFWTGEDMADVYAKHIAPKLFDQAGLAPADVDVASIYDCFTYSVIAQLEGFGFCAPGDGGSFVADGNIGLGGELPVNPNGGMLSEAYIHGLNGAVEMVSQIRGDSGERQVDGAEVAIATGFGTTTGCGVLLAA
jgi:acetyl-CoA acetyltransferase